jgi:hypothetical protein
MGRRLNIGSLKTLQYATMKETQKTPAQTFIELIKGYNRVKVLYSDLSEDRFFGEGGTFFGRTDSLWYDMKYDYDDPISYSLHLYTPHSFDDLEEFEYWMETWGDDWS